MEMRILIVIWVVWAVTWGRWFYLETIPGCKDEAQATWARVKVTFWAAFIALRHTGSCGMSYPIFIPSRGRHDINGTAHLLDKIGSMTSP